MEIGGPASGLILSIRRGLFRKSDDVTGQPVVDQS